jgi:hypothetical protein
VVTKQHLHHAAELDVRAQQVSEEFATRRAQAVEVEPRMVLRFEHTRPIPEQRFRAAGLEVLRASERTSTVVLAADPRLARFRRRSAEYATGPRPIPVGEQKKDGPTERAAPHEDFFDAVESFREVEAVERLSTRLQEALNVGPGAGDRDAQHTVDADVFYVTDPGEREDVAQDLRALVERFGGVMVDEFVNDAARIFLLRVRGDRALVDAVAGFDLTERVDLVPEVQLAPERFSQLQDVEELPEIVAPEDGSPTVGMIDSGVLAGHPLLRGAIVEAVTLEEDLGGGQDRHGHGTAVAGVLLYGDVRRAISNERPVQLPFRVASVRILDGDAMTPIGKSPLRLVRDAVEYLAGRHGCKIINLSIGDSGAPLGSRSSLLAAELDTLARRLDVVIVVSTGNIAYEELVPAAGMLSQWPEYLLDPDFGLLDPAFSASAITVGSLAESAGVAHEGAGVIAVAEAGCPSPFTRRGPGLRGAVKPEVVAFGGNWAVDRATGARRSDLGVEVVSASARYPDDLLCHLAGTSLAAPVVTHILGRLQGLYPELSSRTLRALLLQAAAHTPILKGLVSQLPDEDAKHLFALTGFGAIDPERAEASSNQRVVLWAEDALAPDEFHVYRLPMVDAFANTSGPRSVTISLAFDPPVRYRRAEYLGLGMDFLVVRGISRDEAFDMASPGAGNLEDKLGKHELTMVPGRTARSGGANQAATWTSSRAPKKDHRDDWYVLVRSFNRWLEPAQAEHPYGLAITLEVDRSEELYVQMEAELEAQVRIRV